MIRSRGFTSIGTNVNSRLLTHHVPFDFFQVENIFPRARNAPDEKVIVDALMYRAEELCPSEHEHSIIFKLVTNATKILQVLSLTTNSFVQVQTEEVFRIGSFAMGTILSGHGIADIVLVLKSLPTIEAIHAVTQKLMEGLQAADVSKRYSSSRTERGIDISSQDAAVKILLTTVETNLPNADPNLHIGKGLMESHHTAVSHAKWFEENAFHDNVKILVRLLRDLRNRFDGLKPLSPWLICLLSHYCVMNNPDRQPLAINIAFKRSLQLLSSGFFLLSSTGVIDPCETGHVRAHMVMSPAEQDQVCYTSQTLLRIYGHGGYKHVLGLERSLNIVGDATVWNGVTVTPSDKAFDKKDDNITQMDIF